MTDKALPSKAFDDVQEVKIEMKQDSDGSVQVGHISGGTQDMSKHSLTVDPGENTTVYQAETIIIQQPLKEEKKKTDGDKFSICPDLDAPKTEVEELIKEAVDARAHTDFQSAERLVREALALAEKSVDTDEKTLTYARFLLHRILLAFQKWDEIVSLCNLVLAYSNISRDEDRYIQTLCGKALCSINLGHITESKDILAVLKRMDIKDADTNVELLELEGALADADGDLPLAIKVFSRGAELQLKRYYETTDEGEKDFALQGYSAFTNNIGFAYKKRAMFKDAAAWFLKAAKRLEEREGFNFQLDLIMAYDQYAECCFIIGDMGSGYSGIDKAIAVARKYHEKRPLAKALEMKGRGLAKEDVAGNFEKIMECFKEALEIENDMRDIIHLHRMMGDLCYEINDETAGAQHFDIAVSLAESMDNSDDSFGLLFDIANQRNMLEGKPQSEIPDDILGKMLSRYNKCEDVGRKAHEATRLGLAYHWRKDFETADMYMRAAYNYAKKFGDNARITDVLLIRADIAFHDETEEQDEVAARYIEEANSLIMDLPFDDLKARCLYFRGRLFARREEFEKALDEFTAAKGVLSSSRMHEPDLLNHIEDCLERCDDILIMKKFSPTDFQRIYDEMVWLENWWPDATKSLRRMLWYNRSDEILKLLQASTRSKSIMISDSAIDITTWNEDLQALFFTSTFVPVTNWIVRERYHMFDMCPIPGQMPAFFNTVYCVSSTPLKSENAEEVQDNAETE